MLQGISPKIAHSVGYKVCPRIQVLRSEGSGYLTGGSAHLSPKSVVDDISNRNPSTRALSRSLYVMLMTMITVEQQHGTSLSNSTAGYGWRLLSTHDRAEPRFTYVHTAGNFDEPKSGNSHRLGQSVHRPSDILESRSCGSQEI